MVYFGMTSEAEQGYCREYTRTVYTGKGEIVELGSWMGALTISLAEGLQFRHDNNGGFSHKKVHAYDRFIWEAWMDRYGEGCFKKYIPGDFFLEEFMRRIEPVRNRVEVAGDILEVASFSRPIEFLVIDAMKSWDLANAILQKFYVHLLPGISIVMHQDYKFDGCPWIHLLHWLFRDCFKPITIKNECTMIFQYVKEIPYRFLISRYDYKSFTTKDIMEAFDWSRSITEPDLWDRLDKAQERALNGF